jgi:hypothetical protein
MNPWKAGRIDKDRANSIIQSAEQQRMCSCNRILASPPHSYDSYLTAYLADGTSLVTIWDEVIEPNYGVTVPSIMNNEELMSQCTSAWMKSKTLLASACAFQVTELRQVDASLFDENVVSTVEAHIANLESSLKDKIYFDNLYK